MQKRPVQKCHSHGGPSPVTPGGLHSGWTSSSLTQPRPRTKSLFDLLLQGQETHINAVITSPPLHCAPPDRAPLCRPVRSLLHSLKAFVSQVGRHIVLRLCLAFVCRQEGAIPKYWVVMNACTARFVAVFCSGINAPFPLGPERPCDSFFPFIFLTFFHCAVSDSKLKKNLNQRQWSVQLTCWIYKTGNKPIAWHTALHTQTFNNV